MLMRWTGRPRWQRQPSKPAHPLRPLIDWLNRQRHKRHLRFAAIVLFVLAGLGSLAAQWFYDDPLRGRSWQVTHVDLEGVLQLSPLGDQTGQAIRVQLLGIRPLDHRPQLMRNYLREQLLQQTVQLAEDEDLPGLHNDPALLYVYHRDVLINEHLLMQGLAAAEDRQRFAMRAWFEALENRARNWRQGGWHLEAMPDAEQ